MELPPKHPVQKISDCLASATVSSFPANMFCLLAVFLAAGKKVMLTGYVAEKLETFPTGPGNTEHHLHVQTGGWATEFQTALQGFMTQPLYQGGLPSQSMALPLQRCCTFNKLFKIYSTRRVLGSHKR